MSITLFTPAEIDRLRREAKQLKRAKSILLSHAQNEIALSCGYNNWSLLMKANPHLKEEGPLPLLFKRSSEEMRQAIRKMPRPAYGDHTAHVRSLVMDINADLINAENAVNFAIDYMKCLLSVPRYKIPSQSIAQWEMRCWLPYSLYAEGNEDADRVLVNRRYKPVGQADDQFAIYAEHPQLHVRLAMDQVVTLTNRKSTLGFLYNDGSAPWQSRVKAEAYLAKLQILKTFIKKRH